MVRRDCRAGGSLEAAAQSTSVNLVPLLLTGVRLHPPGRTDKNLCRCFGAPARRVFPDHLITYAQRSFPREHAEELPSLSSPPRNFCYRQKRQKQNPAYVFTKVLNEIETCVLHTASHFLHHAGWTVHSMQQDGILVRPPASLRPEQGDRPGRELVAAAEAALRAIAKQTMDSISKPPPLGLGLDITLTVKELYGIDPQTILRSFD